MPSLTTSSRVQQLYSGASLALCASLSCAPAVPSFAQAITISGIVPMANAKAAPRTAPLTVHFSQALTAASAGALKVFSNQRGGLRSSVGPPPVVNGSTLRFVPAAYAFQAGETVQYTVTTAAAGSGGALERPRVGQFTAAADGPGTGAFAAGFQATAPPSNAIANMAVGDVDGDGALDLILANSETNTMTVRLNNKAGAFGPPQQTLVGFSPSSVAVGDVDGDGDLDVVAGHGFFNQIQVLFNTGTGAFASGQLAFTGVANVRRLALGDVDGDGDVDLLAVGPFNSASVQLNNGNGTFGGPSVVSVGSQPEAVVLGDVDGDGDVDLLVANNSRGGPGSVSIRLNNGAGLFSGTLDLPVGHGPGQVAVADIDGDGDLDVLAANSFSSTVSVRLNDGAGNFSGNQDVGGISALSLAVGDVDADGDLDLLSGFGSNVNIRLNDGKGAFGGTQNIKIAGGGGIGNGNLLLADLDGDGDLDFVTADAASNATITVYLNGGTGPLSASASRFATRLALFPNPARDAATLTGGTPNAPLTVRDGLGRKLLTATTNDKGAARIALPIGLPAGVYFVYCSGQVRRLAVE